MLWLLQNWGAARGRLLYIFNPLRLGELDNHLDVFSFPAQGLREVLRPLASRNEAREPRAVRAGQGLASLVPVPLVGVHGTDKQLILEHCGSRNVSDGESHRATTATDPSETNNAARPDSPDRVCDDLPGASALDDDVRFEPDAGNGASVVVRTEGTH